MFVKVETFADIISTVKITLISNGNFPVAELSEILIKLEKLWLEMANARLA